MTVKIQKITYQGKKKNLNISGKVNEKLLLKGVI